MTEWRDIPNYEARYQVSDDGAVRSLLSGKILKTHPNARGHLRVKLYLGGRGTGRTFLVHRLVLLSFVGPAPESMEALHRDGIPSHNTLDNLHWGTKSENTLDSVTHGTHPMSRKTHCKRDHLLAGDNLIPGKIGRQCRACARLRNAMYRRGERVFGG